MEGTPNLIEKELPREIELLSHKVIGCALNVHRELGPGMLESLYEDAMIYELGLAGVPVQRQVEIGVPYKGTVLRGQRLDLVVGETIIVELKSVTKVLDVHKAQLLSYLRACRTPVGLLFNFNVTWLRDGLFRIYNERATPPFPSIIPVPSSSSSRPSTPSR